MLKYSEYYINTLKEKPSKSELASYSLSLRAGLIRKIASGIYAFLPLGFKVLKKIENIVRDEMNRAGAIELLLPAIQPSELWIKSERWDEYGPEMFRLKDRNNRDFCLGPTHEELITYLSYLDIKSYKNLPVNLYQIQVKFRDEIRPRYGLLRAREFIMKDAYSFSENSKDLEKIYKSMYKAYCRIIERINLKYKVVKADSGLIGGKYSNEFMVLAKNGEEQIVYCTNCGYASNYEMSEFVLDDRKIAEGSKDFKNIKEIKEVKTPGITSIQKLIKFLKISPEIIIKTILVKTISNKLYAILLSGEKELNIGKVEKLLKIKIEMVDDPELVNRLNIGYLGPVKIDKSVKIYADNSIKGKINFVVGANKNNFHLINVNYPRDFIIDCWGDFAYPTAGDKCINCGEELNFEKGIEVGHIFKLGKKYSTKLNATFLDKKGKKKPFVMGCYGIGVSRMLAAVLEQMHDENGIIWPPSIAPFMVDLIITNVEDEYLRTTCEKIYKDLKKSNIEVLYDDRNLRVGVKFKDAELIGIPLRLIVGKKYMDSKKVEVEYRKDGKKVELSIKDINKFIKDFKIKNCC